MNKRRLIKLADFLETVPPAKFDLSTWVQSMPTRPEAKAEGSCGFAGCAVGWAVHAKLFDGLSFDRAEVPGQVNRPPMFEGRYGFGAVDHLFSISRDVSFNLFVAERYPDNRPTPKQVAKRIRKFVETGEIA